MHNKVSCLLPRLLHRVHCRRTSLHFAAPSRVVVLVPVARRDPAHQSGVVVIPPVRWASSSPARLVSRVWSSSSRPVRRASSFRPFFGRRHPVRQSRVVVIQPPVLWASSFRPFFRHCSAHSLSAVLPVLWALSSCSSVACGRHPADPS